MQNRKWSLSGLALLLSAGLAGAHFNPTSLTVNGGRPVSIGDQVDIGFKLTNHHGLIDIALSTDGGKTWSDVKTGVNNIVGANTYKWTVAGTATTTAKIRICQWDDPVGKACTDADSLTQATSGTGGHYILISSAFTINAVTAISGATKITTPISMAFNSATRNVDVTFDILKSEAVSMEAYDMKGQLVATLVDQKYSAGAHRFSVFSNRITQGIMVLKLKVGAEVKEERVNLF